MVTYMNDKKIRSLDDMRAFLAGSTVMEFSITDKAERYRWIECTLRRLMQRLGDIPPVEYEQAYYDVKQGQAMVA